MKLFTENILRMCKQCVPGLSSGGGGGGGLGDEAIIVYTATSQAINEAIKQEIREINLCLHNAT